MPRWIGHLPPSGGVLGDTERRGEGNIWIVDGQEAKSEPPLKGFVSFWPCNDGTETACAYARSIERDSAGDHYESTANDALGVSTAEYSVDVQGGTINVGGWRKSDQAVGFQVQKVSIPCWSMFQSLKGDLRS